MDFGEIITAIFGALTGGVMTILAKGFIDRQRTRAEAYDIEADSQIKLSQATMTYAGRLEGRVNELTQKYDELYNRFIVQSELLAKLTVEHQKSLNEYERSKRQILTQYHQLQSEYNVLKEEDKSLRVKIEKLEWRLSNYENDAN